MASYRSFGTVRAPEFPDGLDWLNTEGPLSMESLRGKLILLDFLDLLLNKLHAYISAVAETGGQT